MERKFILFMFAFKLFTLNVCAQNLTCANLINEVYTDAQIIKPNSTTNPPVKYAKPATQISDVKYADDLAKGSTVYCNSVTDCTDGSSGLIYKVYYPNIQYSDTKKLPAVILFHSGGFSDCTNLDAADIGIYCTEFAKRGFVAFTVEYRRGKEEDLTGKYISASKYLAMYRSIQDSRGAVRTIVSRELNKATPYRIDVQNIFVGGPSAGGIIAVAIAYYNSTMINQVFPSISTYLGGINADMYLGNAGENSYTIKGVLDLWGFANVPLNFASNPASFFSQNSKRPAFIAFHGGADSVIKFDSGYMYFPPSGDHYRSESLCLSNTYTLPDNGGNNPDLKLYGSQGLYRILKTSFNVPCELYIDCDMPHGLNEATSDFGLANGDASKVSVNDAEIYIVQRAATFFQYVMNPNFPYTLKHTKFVDCLNSRYGCNSDAANTCSNSAKCAGPVTISSTSKNEISTSLQQREKINTFFVYPNPAKDILYVQTNGSALFSLFNQSGEILVTAKINSKGRINVSGIAAGLYYLKNNSTGTVQKIVIAR